MGYVSSFFPPPAAVSFFLLPPFFRQQRGFFLLLRLRRRLRPSSFFAAPPLRGRKVVASLACIQQLIKKMYNFLIYNTLASGLTSLKCNHRR